MKYLLLFVVFLSIMGGYIYFAMFRSANYKEITNINSRGETIIALGDSITVGFDLPDKEDAYPAVLSRELGIPVLNAGFSGDTSETGFSRLEKDVFAKNPRIVIVFLGGNDFLSKVPSSHLKENLARIIEAIHEKGAIVVLVGIKTSVLTEDYEPIYKELSATYRTAYVPNVLRRIITNESLMLDSIHPNKEGHILIAKRILEVLNPLNAEANIQK